MSDIFRRAGTDIRGAQSEYAQQSARQHGRCSECGTKGVALQHPSWGGQHIGWAPMPISKMAPVSELR